MNKFIAPVGVIWVLVSIAIGISVFRSPSAETTPQNVNKKPTTVSAPAPAKKEPSTNSAIEAKVKIDDSNSTEAKVIIK